MKYDAFEMNPFKVVGKDKTGKQIVETIIDLDKEIKVDGWAVYGHVTGMGVEWLADFKPNEKRYAKHLFNILNESLNK